MKIFCIYYFSEISQISWPTGSMSLNHRILTSFIFLLTVVLTAILLTFYHYSLAHLIDSFPTRVRLTKSDVEVKIGKSLDYEVVATLGCWLLSSHFKTLIFSSSLSNTFSRPIRWFTMCKLFLHIFYSLSLLHSKQPVLLNQCLFPNPSHKKFIHMWLLKCLTPHLNFPVLNFRSDRTRIIMFSTKNSFIIASHIFLSID